MARTGRYLLSEVVALARVGGLRRSLCPVSVAAMSRIGRYLPYGADVLARIGGRYEPYWPCFAV